jgi:hypothetical protein
MAYDENIKKSIYKWRENNKDKYNNVRCVENRKWKQNNKANHNKKELDRYYFKKECKRLMNILV